MRSHPGDRDVEVHLGTELASAPHSEIARHDGVATRRCSGRAGRNAECPNVGGDVLRQAPAGGRVPVVTGTDDPTRRVEAANEVGAIVAPQRGDLDVAWRPASGRRPRVAGRCCSGSPSSFTTSRLRFRTSIVTTVPAVARRRASVSHRAVPWARQGRRRTRWSEVWSSRGFNRCRSASPPGGRCPISAHRPCSAHGMMGPWSRTRSVAIGR